jgi:hypothetical protein
VNINVVLVDLTEPGIRFELTEKRTAEGRTRETVRETTLDFLARKRAQLAINAHFFVPFPSEDRTADVVGLAASKGDVYSAFEPQPAPGEKDFPDQSYAILPFGPALNLDAENHASIVHRNPAYSENNRVLEPVALYNAVSGSAQIVTEGLNTVPEYKDSSHSAGRLTPTDTYSNKHSWYSLPDARSAIGLTRDSKTLALFTVDKAGGSQGMTVGEVADFLIKEYGVHNALNLDGGGSTSLAIADPATGVGRLANVSSDNRAVGSNLAVFAGPSVQEKSCGPGHFHRRGNFIRPKRVWFRENAATERQSFRGWTQNSY